MQTTYSVRVYVELEITFLNFKNIFVDTPFTERQKPTDSLVVLEIKQLMKVSRAAISG